MKIAVIKKKKGKLASMTLTTSGKVFERKSKESKIRTSSSSLATLSINALQTANYTRN